MSRVKTLVLCQNGCFPLLTVFDILIIFGRFVYQVMQKGLVSLGYYLSYLNTLNAKTGIACA